MCSTGVLCCPEHNHQLLQSLVTNRLRMILWKKHETSQGFKSACLPRRLLVFLHMAQKSRTEIQN